MPRRAGPFASALAVVALALLVAACSQSPGSSSAPTTTTVHTTTPTAVTPAGTWSKPIRIAADADLSVVSCPGSFTCVMGSTTGQTYRLVSAKVVALGTPVPAPSPQGSAYLSCAGAAFCAATLT